MTNVTTDCSTNHNAIGKRIQLEKSAGLPLGITNAQACHKYRFSSSTRNAPRHCAGNPLITQFQKTTATVTNCEFSLIRFWLRRIFSNIRKSGLIQYQNCLSCYTQNFSKQKELLSDPRSDGQKSVYPFGIIYNTKL